MHTVSNFVTSAPISSARSRVTDALRIMATEHSHFVVATGEDGKALGFLTARDVLVRVTTPGVDPDELRIDQVMTWPAITARSDESIATVVRRMSIHGLQSIPVQDSDGLVGVVHIVAVAQASLAGGDVPSGPTK